MPLKNWKNEQSRKSSISRAYPSPKPVVGTIRRAVGHRAKPAVLDQDWSLLSHGGLLVVVFAARSTHSKFWPAGPRASGHSA